MTDEQDKRDPAADPPPPVADQLRQLINRWSASIVGGLDKLAADLKADAGAMRADGADVGKAIAARLGPVLSAARATPRAGKIAADVVMTLGAYRLHTIRVRGLTPGAVAAEREVVDRRSAERAARLCGELSGGVLRLGQLAATRRDLLPDAWIEPLARLDDARPAAPAQAIRARIEAELGAPVEQRFASFDDQPLAIGALAQVHGAVAADGRLVAVKALLPEVEAETEADLTLLELLSSALRGPGLPDDVARLGPAFAGALREELDLRVEAERAARLADALADDPDVLVPRAIDGLSTARVLTRERVDGQPLPGDVAPAEPGVGAGASDAARIVGALVRIIAAQVLHLGLLPPDPGRGVQLAADGRVALVDLAGLRALSDDERRGVALLVGAILQHDPVQAAEHLAALGVRRRTGGDDSRLPELARLVVDAFRPTGDRPASAVRAELDRALALARTGSIEVPELLVMLGRTASWLAAVVDSTGVPVGVPALLDAALHRAAPWLADQPRPLH